MDAKQQFAQKILPWYHTHARALPWRGTSDPYVVWISEIMAQQTRIHTVIPYFERWMQRFPTLESLANAGLQDVLSAWEGLGYYSRARNLWTAAVSVVHDLDGVLPHSRAELERIQGIGRYTAAAIASIAFGEREPVLDGNVKRVLARVFDIATPIGTPQGERELWSLAETLIPTGQPGDYNQAVMELGAMVCTPRSPDCPNCPLQTICLACELGIQAQRPVKNPRPKVPTYTVTAAIFERKGKVLIARRPNRGLLGGMWEFPGGKVEEGESLQQGLVREIMEELNAGIHVCDLFGEYRHAYTHFKVHLYAFFANLNSSEPVPLEASEIRWVSRAELKDYPMGKIDRSISNDLVSQNGLS